MTDEQLAFSIEQDEGIRHRRFGRRRDARHRRMTDARMKELLRQDGQGQASSRPDLDYQEGLHARSSSDKGVGMDLEEVADAGSSRSERRARADRVDDRADRAERRARAACRWSRCATSARSSPTARWRSQACRLDVARRRVPQPARPVGLRQVDGAAASSPASASRPRGTIDWPAATAIAAGTGRHRLRLPGADADAVGDGLRQCLAAAAPRRASRGRRRAPRVDGDAGAGRPRPASPTPIRASCPAA